VRRFSVIAVRASPSLTLQDWASLRNNSDRDFIWLDAGKSESTAAAALMHAVYNLVAFSYLARFSGGVLRTASVRAISSSLAAFTLVQIKIGRRLRPGLEDRHFPHQQHQTKRLDNLWLGCQDGARHHLPPGTQGPSSGHFRQIPFEALAMVQLARRAFLGTAWRSWRETRIRC